VAAASIGPSVDAVQFAGDHTYWLEGRPGGDVLIRAGESGGGVDVLPAGVSVGSSVHEYGGGAYWSGGDTVWFVNAEDQQVWRAEPAGLEPVTTAPRAGEHRYADLRVTASGLLVVVRERHDEGAVTNELVAVPADGSAPPWVIAEGWDFYSFPRPSPDGRLLAWTTWRHPLMPWDGTWLWVAELDADGKLGEPQHVAGGLEESVFQPEWSPDGVLHFVSDRAGWWDLYALRAGRRQARVTQLRSAELGAAQWEFGYSTYAFLDGGRVAMLAQRGGTTALHVQSVAGGELRPVRLPYTSIKPYLAGIRDRVALIGASPQQSPAVVVVDVDSVQSYELTSPDRSAADVPALDPEVLDLVAADGGRVYAMIYRPEPRSSSPATPPVIVRAHPGPTASAPLRFDPWVAFFVGQGFAVLDVDYRGSTGYGRAYRNALRDRWGLLDVSDCIDALAAAGRRGLVDPTRAVMSGASAGGYTALRAATTTDAFRAVAVRSAVVDPETWRTTAPKFQSHHADLLIGPDTSWADRSVLRPGVQARCPILAIHGGKDTVTPLSQAHALAESLGDQVSLVVYPDEGHGLRRPDNLARALTTELAHFRAALVD
jgi:dipeptidyl aminopeptidase/acylaminoacyl peptidase